MKNIVKFSVMILAFLLVSNLSFAQQSDNAKQVKAKNANWVDADGDGICDNFGTAKQGVNNKNKKMKKGSKLGNGQGIGNGDGSALRPQDGTGFGKKNGKGTGVCDGTGNENSGRKGSGRRGGK